VGLGKGEGPGRDFAPVGRDGKGDGAEIRRVIGAEQMDGGGALAIDPFAVHRKECPGAIEFEAAGRGNAGFLDEDGVERLDRVEADVGDGGGRVRNMHREILADEDGTRHNIDSVRAREVHPIRWRR